jgi:hypothetical protein
LGDLVKMRSTGTLRVPMESIECVPNSLDRIRPAHFAKTHPFKKTKNERLGHPRIVSLVDLCSTRLAPASQYSFLLHFVL